MGADELQELIDHYLAEGLTPFRADMEARCELAERENRGSRRGGREAPDDRQLKLGEAPVVHVAYDPAEAEIPY